MVRSWGEKRMEPKLKNHVELVELLGIADLKKGTVVLSSYHHSNNLGKIDDLTFLNLHDIIVACY